MTLRMALELTSTATSSGELVLALQETPVPAPAADEVVVQIRATPINPSDLGLLLGPADLSTLASTGEGTWARIPPQRLPLVAARLDKPLRVGNEGAGVVVEAGADAQHLLGKTVAVLGLAMYAQYRTVKAREVVPLPPGATAADGASAFVNPLTALSMVETMRREGHTGLVHTAAASNLGQMLVRLCLEEKVPLVNLVRSEEQVSLLRGLGAARVLDTTAATFSSDLEQALFETKATLAFDAIGGGPLASQILRAMEAAANRSATAYSRYGSSVHKQVYIYGALDLRPTELDRSYGLAWGVGGWLLTPFLQKLGAEGAGRLRARVLSGLTTTFASKYTETISLRQALQPAVIARYAKRSTGAKFLIDPGLE
jgi:NADPH:quinone reductase